MNKRRPNALDLRHPFFLPLWRRVVLVALMGFWTVVEINYGNPYWALLSAGIGAYAIYVFFFDFTLPHDDNDAP
ncbi:hypothetical protein C1J03_15655 [Sulfitobacter sp. SK012]|uniref:hypothetical protein n=1 Tax=Sulfitobacter sp. SK012 TaxID=1389005 RepID=UPI000E0B2683|nr:hypothetical protein [Sulfitobacter sp. SK012]AXI48935.1 hypothetical protein C1J03_15655 [Sulfitobacter sp. SK012]